MSTTSSLLLWLRLSSPPSATEDEERTEASPPIAEQPAQPTASEPMAPSDAVEAATPAPTPDAVGATTPTPPPDSVEAATPTPPPPASPMPREHPRTWMVGAFVDAGYVASSNLPRNHVNRGLGTAPRTGELTVPLVVGNVSHAPTEAEPWQLELALQFGPAATALLAADPLPGDEASRFTGTEVWQHIGRANVGGRIPRLRTEITAGVMGTPIGYWSFWPKDNWLYSTPWHLNAVPYVLMGGRVIQPVGERVALHAWVVNGWQTYADLNRVPSYMAGIQATPTTGLQLGQFVYFGPEDRDIHPRAFRMLSDTWAVYEAERWGLSAVFDVMRERVTARPDAPVALYVVGSVSPRVTLWRTREDRVRWLLAARGEAFWDRDGRMFGVEQLLGSTSLATDVDLFGHLLLRLEYRYDRSTHPSGFFYRGAAVHDTDPGLGREQHTVFVMATGRFEHWFRTRGRGA